MLRKISDLPDDLCRSAEHYPPIHVVLPAGIWEHTCPECGEVTTFTIRAPYW